MKQVSLIEAWIHWCSGTQLNDYILWGMKVLWWGRIGKVLELLGALTIIAEIVGPVRLRAFGKSIRLIPLPEYYDKNMEPGWVDWARIGLFFIFFLIILVTLNQVTSRFDPTLNFGRAWWVQLVLAVAWIVLVAAMSLVAVVGALISMEFASSSAAGILENAYLDKAIKLIGVALLLIGFHFDLLSS